jgi:Flp pilus assembly protein TadB
MIPRSIMDEATEKAIERLENRLDGVKAELNELNELRKNELRNREARGEYEWLEWLAFIIWAAILIFGTYMALGGWAAFAATGLALLFGWVGRRAMP